MPRAFTDSGGSPVDPSHVMGRLSAAQQTGLGVPSRAGLGQTCGSNDRKRTVRRPKNASDLRRADRI
ncbi:hypothetical protein MMEU_0693 [Mycobacterium marinum str. Europe]|nr:hypothetical protein MMEU_0693 [Mycobacterium marinum str. Europe]